MAVAQHPRAGRRARRPRPRPAGLRRVKIVIGASGSTGSRLRSWPRWSPGSTGEGRGRPMGGLDRGPGAPRPIGPTGSNGSSSLTPPSCYLIGLAASRTAPRPAGNPALPHPDPRPGHRSGRADPPDRGNTPACSRATGASSCPGSPPDPRRVGRARHPLSADGGPGDRRADPGRAARDDRPGRPQPDVGGAGRVQPGVVLDFPADRLEPGSGP